jgi:hypothetical protein
VRQQSKTRRHGNPRQRGKIPHIAVLDRQLLQCLEPGERRKIIHSGSGKIQNPQMRKTAERHQ